MQLVEQHCISKNDIRYAVIDAAAFASKNLYNAANYELRQSFIHNGVYLSYPEMHARMKSHPAYQALPAKVSQHVLKLLDKNWQSFFAAIKQWRLTPEKFLGRPKLPKYKEIDLLVAERIGTLVIGKNENWKQDIHIGKRNNQNFVSIPHARFIDLLTYKAKLVGIQVILTEESYTSKCSFLDKEAIKKHEAYAGKRVKRGLFCTQHGTFINADVNGSFNIIRKVAPESFEGVEGIVVCPVRLYA